jgi:hypothetical protein
MYFDWEGGCIRLVDNLYRDDPNYSEEFMETLPLSNLSQVTLSDSQIQPDPSIFGPEPVHGWCYYFEKADLARQFQDWETIVQLNSEIESQDLEPVQGIEYLPFIEAFAQTDDWSKAFMISKSAYWLTPEIGPALCKNWNKYARVNTSAAGISFISEAENLFCKSIEQ